MIDALTLAMNKSVSSRTVSHLSIPKDLFHLVTSSHPNQPPRISPPSSDPEGLQQALEIMRSAKQPMILVGSSIQLNSGVLQTLAEAWGCGIAMSYGAIRIVPDAYPYMLNGLGEGGNPFLTDLFKESDVVLALETDWWPEQNAPSHARVVQIARQSETIGISLPMDAGLIGDIRVNVLQMIEGLKNYTRNPLWINRIQRCKQTWSAHNEKEGKHAQSPLHPSSIIRAIERNINDDAIIALDEGDSTLWFLRNFRAQHQQVLLSNRWRTMGFGLPAAMASKLCFPQKQIVCITGDGGLGMVLADLLTAKHYGLVITVIVFQNGTLQMEQDKMFMKGIQPEGTTLTNPDFAMVASAFGWLAHRITNTEQLEDALNQAKTSHIPVLLDVDTEQIPHPDFQTS
ncbi:MAG: thiamine pyrophosphate-dependent enzyme [Paenibacillaceae bacterium]